MKNSLTGLSYSQQNEDKRSLAQIKYEHDVVAAGGIYYIATDFGFFLFWHTINFT